MVKGEGIEDCPSIPSPSISCPSTPQGLPSARTTLAYGVIFRFRINASISSISRGTSEIRSSPRSVIT